MNKKFILGLAALLIIVGLTKPDLSSFVNTRPVVVDVIELAEPSDSAIKTAAVEVTKTLKAVSDHKADAKKLRDLFMDIAKLIQLDGDDVVIKNTEEIRQANMLAGTMLRLDIKSKYSNLATKCKEVIVAGVGDDQIVLSPELRAKAVEAFNALAWACNESNK